MKNKKIENQGQLPGSQDIGSNTYCLRSWVIQIAQRSLAYSYHRIGSFECNIHDQPN